MDDHLTFKDHINYVHKKSSKKLGILRKSREYLDRKTSLVLYKSLIVPYIDYCDLVYMCTTEKNLQKLQLIQNTACRIILQVDDMSVKNVHSELNLSTLKDRCNYHLSVECHKNIYNSTSGLHHFFIKCGERAVRTTRGTASELMVVPDIRSELGRRAFSYRGPNHWNKISAETRKINSLPSFKTHLSKETN